MKRLGLNFRNLPREERLVYSREYGRKHRLKKLGITQEAVDTCYELQNGKCRLYQRPFKLVGKGSMAVDHDHTTGRFRGLLCASCNGALGALGDSVEGLERALAYLRGEL